MCNIILFGAGKNGIEALNKYKKNVLFFCDNNQELHGRRINGIEVIPFSKMMDLYRNNNFTIVVTPNDNKYLIGQLELNGVCDYIIYHKDSDLTVFEEENKKLAEKYKNNNELLDEFIHKLDSCNLPLDCSQLKVLSEEVLALNSENKLLLYKYDHNLEGLFYGNFDNLIRYAEINTSERNFFPIVSHQCVFPLYSVGLSYTTAVVFQGDYFKDKIHKYYPYVPVFSVGPYIHYAKSVYDLETTKELKKKFGKTALIFLPHSIEKIHRNYSKQDFINHIIESYSDSFDTFLLSIYWADFNDPIVEYATSKGIKIVSAGFRFDSKFNDRLKTIFDLSDAVICGDLGSFVAYALYQNKPIARVNINNDTTITDMEIKNPIEKQLQISDEYITYKSEFYKLFNEDFVSSDAQKLWSIRLNGYDKIRSPEYIRDIHHISKDIWNACNGMLNYYPDAVRSVYREYYQKNDFNKYIMLKNAVENYLNL